MIQSLFNVIAVLALGVASYFGASSPDGVARFSSDPSLREKLGAVVTCSFPTSTNSFAEGDVIEEEDWNCLEGWVGVRSSTTTDSLSYKLTNSASADPGHTHTTSTVTGVWPFSQGGNATSTTPANNVAWVSNGTNWVAATIPDCDTAASSKLLFDQTTKAYTCGTDNTGGATLTVYSTSTTWTKPAGAVSIRLILTGAGEKAFCQASAMTTWTWR